MTPSISATGVRDFAPVAVPLRAVRGRVRAAYDLPIFVGALRLQWGIGPAIGGLRALGWSVSSSYQGAPALLALCPAGSVVWFLRRDDLKPATAR